MPSIEYVLGLLVAVCVALSSWALKRVWAHETQLATLGRSDTDAQHTGAVLSEVRDVVLILKSSNDGLLSRFQAFELRYDERSTETAKLATDLDKRVALIELHLKYQGGTMREQRALDATS